MDAFEAAQNQFRAGKYSEAADLLFGGGKLDHDGRLLLGISLARCRRNSEAEEVLTHFLTEYPDTFEALSWMSVLTKPEGQGERSVAYAERALKLRPRDSSAYSALGACHQYHRRMEQAISAFKKAVAFAPTVAEHQHNLGLAYQIVYDHARARACFEKAIELAPNRAHSYVALAEDYSLYGSAKAFQVAQRGLKAMPNSAQLHAVMGKVLTRLNQTEQAEKHQREALRLSPTGLAPLASWLVDQGRFEESGEIYEGMLRDNPTQGLAYYGLYQSRRYSDSDQPALEKMRSLRGSAALGPFEQMHLRYAMAKIEEQQGHYEQAIGDYDVANDLAFEVHNAGLPPDALDFNKDNRRVEEAYSKLDKSSPGNPTEAPIFIIGMVRSGTTLLDQILSAHPEVKAAGEIGFWIRTAPAFAYRKETPTVEALSEPTKDYLANVERLVGPTPRFTDKMPLNFACAGIIHAAMPNARLLHIRRNPADTCLSIYTTYFGPSTPFAYNRANIARFYREYQRSMAFWRSVLPRDRLLEFDYEELVTNPKELLPKILEFCGLPWNEAVLFPERNEGAILTPSRWQARQAINRGSVERWKRFEPWLKEFTDLNENG